ncbi:MAG: GNAT family N-acetyltransferase [Hyphomicrobiaceae bacterium]|nr:GNAT family N-acetyltransferase [Hyphomicrobiaceae bacterium]MCC0025083.1 GNAT family N-acetyltransferase [Hyphomicrobiaceae bacterium]
MTEILIDPFPTNEQLTALWLKAWDGVPDCDFTKVLPRSLVHVCAYEEGELIGFVNVAWDGGIHAFLLDTCVAPVYRRRGIATRLVNEARRTAQARGARWLHVDFESQLEGFYAACGFRPTNAGLIDLAL